MNTTTATPHVPLFDRLAGKLAALAEDHAPATEMLREDLLRLFNARNGLTIEEFLGDAPTALHYGLPDTLGLAPQSAADLARWEQVVARAIALYEPRLSDVRVHIERDARHPATARIAIEAVVALGWHLCHVHFHVVQDSAGAQLHAAA